MSCRFCEKMTMPSATLIRKAFVMTLNAGAEEEYERRHRPIWAELEAVFKAHGAHRYSIFLDSSTRQLFGYVEIEDEARWNAIARTDVCQRWWAHMSDIMPSNPDHSPISRDLREVFHLD
jgi:L-rhamnose mutarotase